MRLSLGDVFSGKAGNERTGKGNSTSLKNAPDVAGFLVASFL